MYIEEFLINCLDNDTGNINLSNHEHTHLAQIKFANKVSALLQAIEDIGNTFMKESNEDFCPFT